MTRKTITKEVTFTYNGDAKRIDDAFGCNIEKECEKIFKELKAMEESKQPRPTDMILKLFKKEQVGLLLALATQSLMHNLERETLKEVTSQMPDFLKEMLEARMGSVSPHGKDPDDGKGIAGGKSPLVH